MQEEVAKIWAFSMILYAIILTSHIWRPDLVKEPPKPLEIAVVTFVAVVLTFAAIDKSNEMQMLKAKQTAQKLTQ